MPEKTEPQMAGADPGMEEYFRTQFGFDKNILIGAVFQLNRSEGKLKWEDLSDFQKGALNRLAIYDEEAIKRGFLQQKEAEFLHDIKAGQVPPLESEERKRFDEAIERTGLVKGGLPLEAEEQNSQE